MTTVEVSAAAAAPDVMVPDAEAAAHEDRRAEGQGQLCLAEEGRRDAFQKLGNKYSPNQYLVSLLVVILLVVERGAGGEGRKVAFPTNVGITGGTPSVTTLVAVGNWVALKVFMSLF